MKIGLTGDKNGSITYNYGYNLGTSGTISAQESFFLQNSSLAIGYHALGNSSSLIFIRQSDISSTAKTLAY